MNIHNKGTLLRQGIFRRQLSDRVKVQVLRFALALFCAVALLCVPTGAADTWNRGKVLRYNRNMFTTHNAGDETTHEIGHTTYRVQIDGGDQIYLVERTLNFAWQKLPTLTENGPVVWRLKGKGMVIRDDKGQEFTVSIVETRFKE